MKSKSDASFCVVGCGCLALVLAAVAAVVFLVYASTDPGPPVEQALALGAGILVWYRARGAGRAIAPLRTAPE